ncbi:MAG TPA: SDR family oxidoreductase [Candidatus Pelethocola excrementipullorum]|nr:SDR family oxidoreductase [Candidatus Pelethocola excrementipullorum]
MLKDKVAVVTGGTRGIGYGIVKKFLENGASVVLFGSRKETVDKAVQSLKEIDSEYPVEGMYPNLTDAHEVEQAILLIKEKYKRLDILVNNAGISHSKALYDYTPEEFSQIIDLNVKGIFYAVLPAAKIMKEQGGGCILNTSSMSSIIGQTSGVGYPTTKYAVNGMTISLARELGKDHIRVNAVAPGVTETDMVAALPKEVVAAISAQIPIGRTADPEDVANAFLYLASDQASYVTGEILSVDGGARF